MSAFMSSVLQTLVTQCCHKSITYVSNCRVTDMFHDIASSPDVPIDFGTKQWSAADMCCQLHFDNRQAINIFLLQNECHFQFAYSFDVFFIIPEATIFWIASEISATAYIYVFHDVG